MAILVQSKNLWIFNIPTILESFYAGTYILN